MRSNIWLRVLLTAALVLVGGAVLALAAPTEGDRSMEQRVVVTTDGAVETLTLEDLADGETREFASDEHTITVTRIGDRLELRLDGEEVLGGDLEHDGLETMVWVDDGGGAAKRSERILLLDGGGASGLTTYSIRTTGDDAASEVTVDVDATSAAHLGDVAAAGGAGSLIFTPAAGGEPIVVGGSGPRPGMVRYRCNDDGSELLVPEADATADSYVSPVTGCLLERVVEPETVHVIKIMKVRDVEGGAGD